MNIIVAVLFDNYDTAGQEKEDEDLQELEEKAISLGIHPSVSELIINNDLVVGKQVLSPIDIQSKSGKFSG